MEKKKTKLIGRILLLILSLILVVILAAVIMFNNEIRSLMSIKELDDYGMYSMTYYGDYGFDEFLETGAKSDADIEKFVTKRLTKGLPVDFDVTGAGCTAFACKNQKGEIIYGRNFDFEYAPSMQVYTNPTDAYSSVSTVNLAFAGYSQDNLPSGLNFDSFLSLAAPFLPFDGVNEKGVAIALLAVPEAQPEYKPDRVMLNTTTAIRLVLDKAANVDEAVELLKQYNIYFSGDVDCHFFIADKSGKSVLVEYYDNALQVVQTDTDYQIASNFIAYNGLDIGEGYTEFERYDKVLEAITDNGNVINEDQAVNLLNVVGVYGNDGSDRLQWTVIYNLSNGSGRIYAHRNSDNITAFELKSDE